MSLLAIQLNGIEVAVFIFSFLLLAGTLFFFRKTIIALRFVKEKQTRMADPMMTITRDTAKTYNAGRARLLASLS